VSIHLSKTMRVCAIVAIALACALPGVQAQSKETYTATASLKTAGGASASAPVTVTIDRYATDAERDALMAALKKGGGESARALLAKGKDLGTIQVGARHTPIKYAYARSLGDGRLVTIVTAEPIALIGAGLPGAKPKEGFDQGLALLQLSSSGPGTGELSPAAKIKLDDKGAVVTEDYGAEVVRLTNIVKK